MVIIEGEDYRKRDALPAQLHEASDKNAMNEYGIVLAAGMAVNQIGQNFNEVFHRADENMYTHKLELKKKRPDHNLR